MRGGYGTPPLVPPRIQWERAAPEETCDAPGTPMPSPVPVDLLAPVPRFVMLELTTRCNLRCLYCALSQPEFHGRDLDFDRDAMIAELARLGVRNVQISGHGEATIVPGWHVVARALQAADIRIQLTTNLTKKLSAEELDVFAKMQAITLSCDTVDPETFHRLRRPARLEQVRANLARLKAHLPPRGSGRPFMAVNCTYSDRVVDGLPELLAWARAEDFDAVSLVNLFEYPTVEADYPVRHPKNADPARAIRRIHEAAAIARELGLEFNVMDGLIAELEEAVQA